MNIEHVRCWKGSTAIVAVAWLLRIGCAAAMVSVVATEVAAQESASIPNRIVVATREVPPFAMKNDEGEWIGISIDLLREVKAELQSRVEQETVLEFREMGLEEMLDAVEAREVDLAAAAITVNYEREKRMDFSHPLYSSGLGIAVGAQQRPSGWTGTVQAVFSRIFLRIVVGLFVAMLLSAVAVYLFERRGNREQFGGGAIRGIASGLWWAAVTLTTVGYGDKVPRTLPGRLIGLVWMFAGLFIVAGFTASVTSALTVTQLKSRISGPADLSRVRVATVQGSTAAKYLDSRHIVAKQYPNVRAALAELRDGQYDAVVYDVPILQHEACRHFAGEVFVLPMTFERQNYAFALPSDSPLRERINLIVLRKIGSPEWDDVLAGYLGESFQE